MSAGERPVATPSQTVGPFFHFGLATDATLGSVWRPGATGGRIRFGVRVVDGNGDPLPDALVELYQADGDGRYARAPFAGFGRLPTDAAGRCEFDTLRPGAVSHPPGPSEAPHINLCVLARGLLRHVYTRAYFEDADGLDADPLLALVPEERRHTLMARRRAGAPDAWEFLIRLQGADETVFFDV